MVKFSNGYNRAIIIIWLLSDLQWVSDNKINKIQEKALGNAHQTKTDITS